MDGQHVGVHPEWTSSTNLPAYFKALVQHFASQTWG